MNAKLVIGGVVVMGGVGVLLAWLMFASVQPSAADIAEAAAIQGGSVVDAGVP